MHALVENYVDNFCGGRQHDEKSSITFAIESKLLGGYRNVVYLLTRHQKRSFRSAKNQKAPYDVTDLEISQGLVVPVGVL